MSEVKENVVVLDNSANKINTIESQKESHNYKPLDFSDNVILSTKEN